jgi:biopolymer transport protein ExbD
MRLAAGALLQAADAVESNKTQSASPVKVSDQVSLIMDRKQYDNHKTQTVLSHLDQSDDDNVELKIKTKVNSNCKIVKL